MKKIAVFILTLSLMMINLGSVLADNVSVPPVNEISSNSNYASVERSFSIAEQVSFGLKGGPGIAYIKSSISKKSSTSISIAATTESSLTSSKIGGQISVQRWMNNKWSTYTTLSFWAHFTAQASITKTISVPTGYYYRIKVTHIASNSDGTDSIVSITNSVHVN